ncbi:unnamed protein product [Cyprideis torosa]|uniref:Uncharacterized protein n=1 Tax=Cyprideis torosa TaxID=163714 RepID=A0A7R8W4I0_9CRUS|nr:unnamed protein product [Cyprideis torosa]CAG0879869.1 unnamed protein product [Cyprideis torosa]
MFCRRVFRRRVFYGMMFCRMVFCQRVFFLSKRVLSKGILSKDVLSKDVLLKDVLSKDVLLKDVLCLSKGVLRNGVLSKGVGVLLKDVLSKDALSKDALSKDALSKDVLSKGFIITLTTLLLDGAVGDLGHPKAPQNSHVQNDEGPDRYFSFESENGQFRKEYRTPNGTQFGSYGWIDSIGNLRKYKYIADDWGYRIVDATVQKNVYGGNKYSNYESMGNDLLPPMDHSEGYSMEEVNHYGNSIGASYAGSIDPASMPHHHHSDEHGHGGNHHHNTPAAYATHPPEETDSVEDTPRFGSNKLHLFLVEPPSTMHGQPKPHEPKKPEHYHEYLPPMPIVPVSPQPNYSPPQSYFRPPAASNEVNPPAPIVQQPQASYHIPTTPKPVHYTAPPASYTPPPTTTTRPPVVYSPPLTEPPVVYPPPPTKPPVVYSPLSTKPPVVFYTAPPTTLGPSYVVPTTAHSYHTPPNSYNAPTTSYRPSKPVDSVKYTDSKLADHLFNQENRLNQKNSVYFIPSFKEGSSSEHHAPAHFARGTHGSKTESYAPKESTTYKEMPFSEAQKPSVHHHGISYKQAAKTRGSYGSSLPRPNYVVGYDEHGNSIHMSYNQLALRKKQTSFVPKSTNFVPKKVHQFTGHTSSSHHNHHHKHNHHLSTKTVHQHSKSHGEHVHQASDEDFNIDDTYVPPRFDDQNTKTMVAPSIGSHQNHYVDGDQFASASNSHAHFAAAPATLDTSYSPPSKPVNTYSVPSKPVSTYGPPSKPASTYGPPSKPVSIYGPPSKPVATYSVPAKPVSTEPVATYSAPSKPTVHEHHHSPEQIHNTEHHHNHHQKPSKPVTAYTAPPKPMPTYSAPSKPESTYGPPSKPVATYSAPSKPDSTYGPPSKPVATYSAPSKPESTYGPPSKPVATYSAPSKPESTYGPPSKPVATYSVPFKPESSHGSKPESHEPHNHHDHHQKGSYHHISSEKGISRDPLLTGVYIKNHHDQFGYNDGRQFHYEKTLSNGDRVGEYGYIDPFGIKRVVKYSTDDWGFHGNKESQFVGTGHTLSDH